MIFAKKDCMFYVLTATREDYENKLGWRLVRMTKDTGFFKRFGNWESLYDKKIPESCKKFSQNYQSLKAGQFFTSHAQNLGGPP